MSQSRRGIAAERWTVNALELVGYEARRTAASHGLFDVVAVNQDAVRLIQVCRGRDKYPCELETFELLAVPPNVSKEVWRWPTSEKAGPLIRKL